MVGHPHAPQLQLICPAKKKKSSSVPNPIEDIRLDQCGHFPAYEDKQQHCLLCKTLYSHLWCCKCQVHLCQEKSRNCQLPWIVKGLIKLQNNCIDCKMIIVLLQTRIFDSRSMNHDHHIHTGDSKPPSQAFEIFLEHEVVVVIFHFRHVKQQFQINSFLLYD